MSGAGLPAIVVPCFNEAERLDLARFGELAGTGRLRLLFVDGGSGDGTRQLLDRLQETAENVSVLGLERNQGKAEAVRAGLLDAIANGATVVGYYDADLATPPEELLRLIDLLSARPETSFVMASRVALLGRTIERSAVRHYLGRVFATLAATTLRLHVYDTQCGAKVFRVSPAVVEALDRPFRSSWAFDVELLARVLHPHSAPAVTPQELVEMPLHEWHDVPGSTLGPLQMAGALADLVGVAIETRRNGRGARRDPEP